MTTVDASDGGEPRQLSLEERNELLTRAISAHAAKGWAVESQSPTQASLAKGKNTSHGVHIFLSIITVGLWIPVWILISIVGGRRTRVITVNEYGAVSTSK